jgi:hypothetical protein
MGLDSRLKSQALSNFLREYRLFGIARAPAAGKPLRLSCRLLLLRQRLGPF